MKAYLPIIIPFLISLLSTFLLTFPIKKLSYSLGFLDYPEKRKIHQKAMPQLGGLAIFLGVFLGLIYWRPEHGIIIKVSVGALIVFMTGLLDDKYDLRPFYKLTGQLLATAYVIYSGLTIDRLTLPLIGVIELGVLSIPVTIFWIIGITNAINLMDGLDGLATGITTIAFISISTMALIHSQLMVATLCLLIVGACLGFLYHNFHPASIYMGDSGSNFLGFMIATISILGLFKNVTLFSFIFPLIILAVPIFDTFLVMFRRFKREENIMMADRKHIHYRLLAMGYSHRQAVLILYSFGATFGFMAVLLSRATFFLSLLIAIALLFLFLLLAEVTGVGEEGEED